MKGRNLNDRTRNTVLCGLPLLTLALVGGQVRAAVSTGTGGHGVTVGNSALIDTYDYSDTFTWGPTATVTGRQNYTNSAATSSTAVRQVENSYGNPTVYWNYTSGNFADFGSLTKDSGISNGTPTYPGSSGAGSSTGITQSGYTNVYDFSVQYGLRQDFVVQYDTVLTSDRVDISVNNAAFHSPTAFGAGNNQGLMVFFRSDDNVRNALAVYYGGVEYDTGLSTGLTSTDVGKWENFAVRFDLIDKQLTFWVNENLLGTWSWASLTPFATADISSTYVGLGASKGTRLWTDNFQVGSAVVAIPEPATLAGMGLLVGAGLIRRRR